MKQAWIILDPHVTVYEALETFKALGVVLSMSFFMGNWTAVIA